MSLEVHSLASGSSGNAMLVRGVHGSVLLDCGMPRRFIEAALQELGADPRTLAAIFLTHEHSDHARGAVSLARRYNLPIAASEGTLAAVVANSDVTCHTLQPQNPVELGEFIVTGYPVSHDAREPMAFSITAPTARVCYAVDLGMPDSALVDACMAASLVVLESNHAHSRLLEGPYDPWLKQRILSQKGHLSNEDAADVITRVTAADRPTHFWLAHLSAVNNSPRTALRTATGALRKANRRHCAVEIALRDRPSLHWTAGSRWWQPQLTLDWSCQIAV